MDFLSNLPKTTIKKAKRHGQGYGSGKGGHTVGRGQKGQKSRGKVKLLFEGTKTNKDFYRRTPWLRGKKRNKVHVAVPVTIQLSQLEVFKDGDEVTLEALVKARIITKKESLSNGVKVLFDKKIEKKLVLQVPASKAVINALQ